MADADNHKNERLLKATQKLRKSSSSSPWPPLSPWAAEQDTCTASGESAAGNISDTSLKKIQIVAQQLVMNSPDRQRSLIRPHLRASVPPYDSPDSCPPPPNNTPDSDPSNNSDSGCTNSLHTPYSTGVLKPPEKNANWTVSPVIIPESTPIGIHGLAPPGFSRWTATPVSMVFSPCSISGSIPSNIQGTSGQSTTGNSPGSAHRISSSNVSTPVRAISSTATTFCRNTSSLESPIPNIVVTPPIEEHSPSNSYVLSTPDITFSTDLNCSGIPRLRSDSEGSVSSILSLNSAMLKLIDTSLESNYSSFQGLNGTDVQSDMSSDMESLTSVTSKSSSNISSKESCVKKDKDLRKKLLQNLLSVEMTRREEEFLKTYNKKLMEPESPKHNQKQRFQHVHVQPTCGSTPVKLIAFIILLAITSFVMAWLFTNILGPLQKRILVGDYDTLDAAKEPHRLPWLPEYEEIGSVYKYGGVRDVLTKMTSGNIGSENDPLSTVHDGKDEKKPYVDDYHNIEVADLGALDPSVDFNDLHRLEEINHDLEIVLDDEYNNEYQLAFEEGIGNEANDKSDTSASVELDDGIASDKEVSIENMKPTILKLLYYNILRSHENGNINMISYTYMYRFLNSFLTTFGSFAATQSKMLNDRIHTLEKLKDHNVNYTRASSMFIYEIESGLIDDEFPISGSMIFTCLHRHLQFLQAALGNIIKIKPSESLFVAFRAAYDDVLADYHHWFVEKFYLLGFATLPTKADALQRLNERFVEVSSMAQLSSGLKLVVEQLQELNEVTEVLLNKHNVLQMIPAQVIT